MWARKAAYAASRTLLKALRVFLAFASRKSVRHVVEREESLHKKEEEAKREFDKKKHRRHVVTSMEKQEERHRNTDPENVKRIKKEGKNRNKGSSPFCTYR